MKKIIITIIILTFYLNIQTQFKVTGEFRPRFEFSSVYKEIMQDTLYPAYFISQRSRQNFEIIKDQYEARISIQNVRVWGEEALQTSTGNFADNASLDLYESWFKLYFLKDFSINIGRQTLKYDDERLLANRNWNQNALNYDAVLLGNNKNKISADFCLSLNNSTEKNFGTEYPSDRFKMLDFLYIKKSFNDDFYVSAIALATTYQKKNTHNTIYVTGTYGIYLKANTIYQNGKTAKGKDVNAYMFTAEVGYKQPKIEFYLGKDNFNTDSIYQTVEHNFNPFYIGRHKFNGYMDYFSSISKSTSNAGLIVALGKLVINATDKTKLNVHYHYFMLANSISDFTNPELTANPFLGHKLDFTFDYKFNKTLALQIGYNFLILSKTFENINKIKEGYAKFS